MTTKNLILTIVIAVITGVSSVAIYSNYFDNNTQVILKENDGAPVKYVNLPGGVSAPDFTIAAKTSVDAVVHVKTKFKGVVYEYSNPITEFFYGRGDMYYQPPTTSTGSGVIISPDGYIVTNNHVIENADEIEVVLNNNKSFKATLTGSDPSTDIAVLKIDGSGYPFMVYGDSDALNIGEWVLAVGNPFNLTSTVTAGIVSAKARNINLSSKQFAIESFIQTDAVVNPGNSGGALVNSRGELIGINTAIASRTGSFMGYSFAIPVNIVKKVVDDIRDYGKVQRAYLGISIIDINSDIAKQLKIESVEGIYVTAVAEGGSAAMAGIKPGDIIIGFGDIKVNKVAELQEQASKYRPGDKVQITYERNGKVETEKMTMQNANGNTNLITK
ncbi:MAG: hypothetical protein A2W91_13750 [Bacteroidetes bacterium GWF2_38_335]|nr:MAG: hypothetical protein A2W91_13750 [Bacteroidetes bacterium GWF2_38_335]OFY77781.1 MAG: hypothetical protein A2281_15440 [Bacteroidetes bacterium RIFOXYA12_FULL_38_20]HBS87415.1 deoxyribonuclease HsdR [Bacteroidales bacterium]